MGRELTKPSTRLTAAAQLAAAILFDGETGNDYSAIDVGCDHAKLAIYLVQSGICKKVLACDINDGPVKRAKENVSRRKLRNEPLDKYITVIKNDGLEKLDDIDCNRIFILGMGGDLISGILDRAKFLKSTDRKIAFILQAMTSEEDLRKYLSENGFKIVKEQLVEDKSRVYSIILSVYDGIKRELNQLELILGNYNALRSDDLFDVYLDRKIRIQNKLVTQLKKAGKEYDNEQKLLEQLLSLK